MTTTRRSQALTPGREAVSPLPPPQDRPAWEWTDKVVTAGAARALGRRLREGKLLVLRERRHLSG